MKHSSFILGVLIASTLLLLQRSFGQVLLTSLYPDSVSPTAAVFRASINPGGSTGEVKFLWGVSPEYQHVISAGTYSGSNPIQVRKRVEGLTPDVLYEYQAVWIDQNPEIGGIVRFRTIADSSHVGYVNYLAFFGGNIGNELAFGIHTQATHCLDQDLGELWIPPPGPQGAPDFRFVDPRGFNSQCMDQGLLLDLRAYRGTAQIDTYKVRFDPGSSGYPALISWSDVTRHYSGNVHLSDPSGIVVNVDMRAQSSVLVNEPITNLLIIASDPANPFIVMSSLDETSAQSTFSLSHNYPNPFNPTTTIKYHAPAGGFVSLKVFDVLGREVVTLVNDQKEPGNHFVMFDAGKFTSGVYFYRLQAGGFVQTRKLLLLR